MAKEVKIDVVDTDAIARTAVLQMEISTIRHTDSKACGSLYYAQQVVDQALKDTLRQGGTFVVIVSADKITLVQRSDAEDI